MIIPNSMSENLLYMTSRIEVSYQDGMSGVGTGFFFHFNIGGNAFLPAIITNKHVIRNATVGTLYLHRGENRDGQNVPVTPYVAFQIGDFASQWISHPNPDIDLCAIPLEPIRRQIEKQNGNTIYYIPLNEKVIPSQKKLEDLTAIEDIYLIGYPIGLFDEAHNLPIIRRGITATHPGIPFQNKSIGIIDAACFPGSSGSPVIIMNEGMFHTKYDNALGTVGTRFIFLGVLFGGPYHTQDGNIEVQSIPTREQSVSRTRQMIHLGYYVKSEEIFVLRDEVLRVAREKGQIPA
jgi:hypothetical protein